MRIILPVETKEVEDDAMNVYATVEDIFIEDLERGLIEVEYKLTDDWHEDFSITFYEMGRLENFTNPIAIGKLIQAHYNYLRSTRRLIWDGEILKRV